MPVAIAERTPVYEFMVAALVLLLAHDPPEGVEFSVVVEPQPRLAVPVIDVGNGFTVMT